MSFTADWMLAAALRLRVSLHRHSTGQAAGPCPHCGGRKKLDSNRLCVWETGNYWCRKCDRRGWWLDTDPDPLRERAGELARQREERAIRQRAGMASDRSWRTFHEYGLQNGGVGAWEQRGVDQAEYVRRGLGIAHRPPVGPDCDWLTIPVWYRGVLMDVRLRSLSTDPAFSGPRYRSLIAGVPSHPYDLDSIRRYRDILIVEGEIKTILIKRAGYGVIGLPGVRGGLADLYKACRDLHPTQTITIGFDPGADTEAEGVAEGLMRLGATVLVASFFDKPDDLLQIDGKDVFDEILAQARLWK